MSLSRHLLGLMGLGLLVGLSACATPQQRCVASASADARGLLAEIREKEATIERGYALFKQTKPYRTSQICYTKEKKAYLCWQTRFREVETPVTVDIPNQKAQLASMKARFGPLQRKAVAGIKACRKAYPE
ncbi:hypothetical protein [Aliiroseovarius sp. 2305UL8-7]|uniref:hypothetical protein n=1 Tax=Aliiroseovarius conchicola TaxID=3121637 RepID=UPI003528DC24